MTANPDRFEVIAGELLELRKDSNAQREALLQRGDALLKIADALSKQGDTLSAVVRGLERNTEALAILIRERNAGQNGQS